MRQASTKTAWVCSLAVHVSLLGLAFLGYRSLCEPGGDNVSGLVKTELDDIDYGEVELSFDEPRRPRVQPSAPPPTVEVPAVPAPKLEPVETVPTPAATRESVAKTESQPQPQATGAAPSAPAPVAPNSGKGSPLHPSVMAGTSIVYVLDCSASMGRGSNLKEACAALMASLEQLSPEVEFQVILYQSFAERMSIRGSTDKVPATTANKLGVQARLAELVSEGTSNHLEGLSQAFLLNPSAIFLLTDAVDLTEKQLIEIGLRNRGTVIYPVLFGQKERLTRSSLLDRLAQANRGRVIKRD